MLTGGKVCAGELRRVEKFIQIGFLRYGLEAGR